MKIYLPSPNYRIAASYLDRMRLQSQLDDCRFVCGILSEYHEDIEHLGDAAIWQGYERELADYGFALIQEAASRKNIKMNITSWISSFDTYQKTQTEACVTPWFLNNPNYWLSHAKELIEKNPVHYKGRFPKWFQQDSLKSQFIPCSNEFWQENFTLQRQERGRLEWWANLNQKNIQEMKPIQVSFGLWKHAKVELLACPKSRRCFPVEARLVELPPHVPRGLVSHKVGDILTFEEHELLLPCTIAEKGPFIALDRDMKPIFKQYPPLLHDDSENLPPTCEKLRGKFMLVPFKKFQRTKHGQLMIRFLKMTDKYAKVKKSIARV